MAAAPEIAEAPALLWLAPFAISAVCIALLYAYESTLGAVLGVIARNINVGIPVGFGKIHPFAFIANGIDALNSVVRNALGIAIKVNHKSWDNFLTWHAIIWHETTRVIGDLADETRLTFHWLIRHHLSDAIFAYLNPISALVDALRKQVPALAGDVAKLGHVTTRIVVHDIPQVKQVIVKQTPVIVKTATVAATGGLAIPWPRIRGIERDVSGLEKRVNGLGRKLALPVMVGLVAASLEKLGLNAARCSRTQRWDKQLCGMDQDLLNALIADTLLILGTLSLEKAAEDMQEVMDPISDTVRHFWRADK